MRKLDPAHITPMVIDTLMSIPSVLSGDQHLSAVDLHQPLVQDVICHILFNGDLWARLDSKVSFGSFFLLLALFILFSVFFRQLFVVAAILRLTPLLWIVRLHFCRCCRLRLFFKKILAASFLLLGVAFYICFLLACSPLSPLSLSPT